DPLADLDVLGMADAHHRQVLRLDLEERDVAVPIGAHHLRRELPAVGQLDIDFPGAVDHVGVGENVAVGADDEARADAAHRRLLRHRQPEVPEESEQRVVFVEWQQLPGGSADRLVTLMLTTAGPACSASSLKSGALNPAPAEACATTASAGAFAVGDAVDGEPPATNAGRNAAMTAAPINFTFIGIPLAG